MSQAERKAKQLDEATQRAQAALAEREALRPKRMAVMIRIAFGIRGYPLHAAHWVVKARWEAERFLKMQPA
jgi:hypothetical protein